ncbi:hypothetical protein L0222_26300 [bacterium]|nr:hypothetical protein [bacterium]
MSYTPLLSSFARELQIEIEPLSFQSLEKTGSESVMEDQRKGGKTFVDGMLRWKGKPGFLFNREKTLNGAD